MVLLWCFCDDLFNDSSFVVFFFIVELLLLKFLLRILGYCDDSFVQDDCSF